MLEFITFLLLDPDKIRRIIDTRDRLPTPMHWQTANFVRRSIRRQVQVYQRRSFAQLRHRIFFIKESKEKRKEKRRKLFDRFWRDGQNVDNSRGRGSSCP